MATKFDMQSRFARLMNSRFEKRLKQAFDEAARQDILLLGCTLIFSEGCSGGYEMFMVNGFAAAGNPQIAKEWQEDMAEFSKWRAERRKQ